MLAVARLAYEEEVRERILDPEQTNTIVSSSGVWMPEIGAMSPVFGFSGVPTIELK